MKKNLFCWKKAHLTEIEPKIECPNGKFLYKLIAFHILGPVITVLLGYFVSGWVIM